MKILTATCASLLLLLLPMADAAAVGAGAVNLTFNTSTRFEAMGGAGVAAPWGADTNHWANPSLLAFRPGLNYLKYRSELAVGLADDIVLTNEELTLGAYGVTLLWAKSPVDGNYLDMGTQMGTDENGNPTGFFDSYMAAESWGLGLEAVQLVDRFLRRGEEPWSRYAAFAVGFTKRDFEDRLAPDYVLQDVSGGSAAGSVTDLGVTLRATPLRIDDYNGYFGLTVGLAVARSLLADTDEFIVHVDADQSDPFPRAYVRGWSVHAELPLAPGYIARHPDGFGGLLTQALDPLLSITYSSQTIDPGYVWNESTATYEYTHDTSGRYDEEGHGWELGVLNIFYLRRGHLKMDYGDIDADTAGWGINLQAGRLGGLRIDHARVPQAEGLPNVTRDGWSLWVDPVAIIAR